MGRVSPRSIKTGAAAATKATQTGATRFDLLHPAVVHRLAAGQSERPRVLIAAIGIKRLGLAAATLAGAAFAALVILSLLIPADTVRDAIKAEIRTVTGLDPVLRGDVAVSLFPTGTVVLRPGRARRRPHRRAGA